MLRFALVLLGLAACHSDQELKGQQGQPQDPSDPVATPPVIDTPSSDTTDSGTSTSTGSAADDTGTATSSSEVVVPCSLPPDSQRLTECAAGSFAATLAGVGYPTIQGAIDTAGAGDVVVVCPGTWSETLQLGAGKHLEAADPTAGVTTLDVAGATHAIEIPTDATLVGFTITGATGGAVVQEGDALTMQCMTLVDNDDIVAGGSGVGGDGGGVSARGALVILESLFDTNRAGQAGGAVLAGGPTVEITDSTFIGNKAGYEGGAVDLGEAVTTLTRVLFDGNSSGYQAGAVNYGEWDDGSLTVVDSTFQNNTADYEGGAIDIGAWGTDAVSISGSTFTANDARYSAGAIQFGSWGGLSATITDTTFSANTSREDGAIELGGWLQDGGTLTLDTVTFEDNVSTAASTGGALGTSSVSGVLDVVATGVVAYRNQGGPRGGALSLSDDDTFECTACDFGAGADDNGPNDAVKGSSGYNEVGTDFQL